MTLATRRGPVPCVCRAGCPGFTWPLESYFITELDSLGNPTLGYDGRMMRGPAPNAPPNTCTFGAVVPQAPFLGEQLAFRQITCPAGQDGFAVRFSRTTPPGFNEAWEKQICWDIPSPIPIDPNSAISCSQVVFNLPKVLGGGSTSILVEAAYPDACDQNDYPAKVQSPWHHDTPR